MACGQDYSIALGEDGKLYSFGAGGSGSLGLASTKQQTQPALIEALADKKVTNIIAGWKHAACLTQED